jgi:GT2 family glycosyltransferase
MDAYGLRAMVSREQLLKRFPPLTDQEPVTVVILNYNGRADIADAIRSVQRSTHRPAEILVVDDGSTDGSVAFIREHFPEVRIVGMGRNTKMLNQVRNRGLREAKTRLVFLMDHDVLLEPSCLAEVRAHMQALPAAAALTTRALFQQDHSRIYVGRQWLHFLCNTVAFNRDGQLSTAEDTPQPSVGWGTQLIDKEKAALLGFFDEDYVMGWGDDGEFHYKIHLAGLSCYNIPRAVVYHKRDAGADRIYGSIRNRWFLIIETYALRTLVILGPALLLYELMLLAFLCVRGQANQYLRALQDTLRSLRALRAKRARVQKMRARPDADLLVGGPIYIRDSFVPKAYLKLGMALLNGVFEGYWRLCRRFI